VGQAYGQLGQTLPQVTFGVWGCLPGCFQDLVRVKRPAFVQKPLRFNQAFVG
jgi:hypothetical protein